MIRKIYIRIMSGLFSKMQNAHREYLEMQYRNAKNVKLGENVKFPFIKNGPPSCGKIVIGNNSWVCAAINMFPHNEEAILSIGEDCYIGDESRIWCARK